MSKSKQGRPRRRGETALHKFGRLVAEQVAFAATRPSDDAYAVVKNPGPGARGQTLCGRNFPVGYEVSVPTHDVSRALRAGFVFLRWAGSRRLFA